MIVSAVKTKTLFFNPFGSVFHQSSSCPCGRKTPPIFVQQLQQALSSCSKHIRRGSGPLWPVHCSAHWCGESQMHSSAATSWFYKNVDICQSTILLEAVKDVVISLKNVQAFAQCRVTPFSYYSLSHGYPTLIHNKTGWEESDDDHKCLGEAGMIF